MTDKQFYGHLCLAHDGAQFFVDLCATCHDHVMNGRDLQATDAPQPHDITEEWEHQTGHDCHVCGALDARGDGA